MPEKVPQPHGGAVNRFQEGESGNPKGRPPRLLSTIVAELKSQGYERATASNVVEAFETLMNVPKDALEKMVKQKDIPMSLKIVGEAMMQARGWEVLNAMMDRAHGKAKQSVDLSGAGAIPVPTVTVVVQALKPDGA